MPRPKLPPGMVKTGAQRQAESRAKKKREEGEAYMRHAADLRAESRQRFKDTATPEQKRDFQDASNVRVSKLLFPK